MIVASCAQVEAERRWRRSHCTRSQERRHIAHAASSPPQNVTIPLTFPLRNGQGIPVWLPLSSQALNRKHHDRGSPPCLRVSCSVGATRSATAWRKAKLRNEPEETDYPSWSIV